jgi:uncharacterized protein with GYD domain
MAELPKDIGPYGGVGLLIYELLPYAEGGDVKSRVTNMGVSGTLVEIHGNRQNASTTERSKTMATFVTLINFTDQGIRNIKDSPKRFESFKALVEAQGGTVKSVYYTLGSYDMVVIVEGDEAAAMAGNLTVGSLGNVRTQTLRGFSVDEMKSFISKMP